MQKASDSKLVFIKFARIITYLVYVFFILATVFLLLGFFLLLFGANPNTSFVNFVYHFASIFLQPFRGIFPGHQLSDTSYFSGAALFAVIMYGIGAMLIHSLITYITLKQTKHQKELDELQDEANSTKSEQNYRSSTSGSSQSRPKSSQQSSRQRVN